MPFETRNIALRDAPVVKPTSQEDLVNIQQNAKKENLDVIVFNGIGVKIVPKRSFFARIKAFFTGAARAESRALREFSIRLLNRANVRETHANSRQDRTEGGLLVNSGIAKSNEILASKLDAVKHGSNNLKFNEKLSSVAEEEGTTVSGISRKKWDTTSHKPDLWANGEVSDTSALSTTDVHGDENITFESNQKSVRKQWSQTSQKPELWTNNEAADSSELSFSDIHGDENIIFDSNKKSNRRQWDQTNKVTELPTDHVNSEIESLSSVDVNGDEQITFAKPKPSRIPVAMHKKPDQSSTKK